MRSLFFRPLIKAISCAFLQADKALALKKSFLELTRFDIENSIREALHAQQLSLLSPFLDMTAHYSNFIQQAMVTLAGPSHVTAHLGPAIAALSVTTAPVAPGT